MSAAAAEVEGNYLSEMVCLGARRAAFVAFSQRQLDWLGSRFETGIHYGNSANNWNFQLGGGKLYAERRR